MRFILRRGIFVLLTIFTVITLNFFLIRLMPGNPADYLLMQLIYERSIPVEEAYKLVQVYFSINLTRPLHEQYFEYIGSLLRGNLGTSLLSLNTPVSKIIALSLPWTVFLLSISIPISFAIGVILGMIVAYKRGGKIDSIYLAIASTMNSIPNYVYAIFLLFTLAVIARLFPLYGAYSTAVKPAFTFEFLSNVFYHAALPILSYILASFTGWGLAMRASTISVLGEDYVTAAKARGLSEKRIIISYVGRNAILPLFTSLVISLGYMMGGAVFIETIFSYPGIGYFLVQSINGRDYPLMQGCFLVLTVAVVTANFTADLLYSKLDPRIKL